MPFDEAGGVGVLPISERVGLPRIRQLVRVRLGVTVKGVGVGVIPWYVRVKGGRGALILGRGAQAFALGGGNVGAERGVVLVRGTGGRVGAGAWVG